MLRSGILLLISILLLGAAFYADRRYEANYSSAYIASDILPRLQSQMQEVQTGASQLLNNEKVYQGKASCLFEYDSGKITKWTAYEFSLEKNQLPSKDGWYFHTDQIGSFLLYKQSISSSRFVIGIVPLARTYKINNRYLSSSLNSEIFGRHRVNIFSPDALSGVPVYVTVGQFYFKIEKTESEKRGSGLTILLGCLSIFFFLWFLFQAVRIWSGKQKYFYSFALLLAGLFLLRLVMIYYGFPYRWLSSVIFDPQTFASSSYNITLWDLLLNAIIVLICCSYLFWTYSKMSWIRWLQMLGAGGRISIAILLMTMAYLCFLFPYLFIETILHNSSISFDAALPVQSDTLRIVSLIALAAGGISSFMFCHVLVRVTIMIVHDLLRLALLALSGGALLFLLYSFIMERDYLISLLVGTSYFIILIISHLPRRFSKISPSVFMYMLLAACAYSIQSSFAVKKFTTESSLQSQFRFAENYLINNDLLGEFLLDECAKRIENDPLIVSRFSTPFLAKSVVRQKIRQVYLNNYFDRYETKINLYSATGEPFDDLSSENFATRIRNFQNIATRTSYPNIYFIRSWPTSLKRYLTVVPIQRSGAAIGYIVLELTLKKVIPNSVFPELLSDNRFQQFFADRDYSYGFFQDGKLIGSSGAFNYEKAFNRRLLGSNEIYRKGIMSDGRIHVAVEDDSGLRVVVTSDAFSPAALVTNFSFFFLLALVIIFGWMLAGSLLNFIRGNRFSYSMKIQLYTYLAFILPLTALTITSLQMITRSEEEQIKNDYRMRSMTLGESIKPYLDNLYDESLNESVIKMAKNSGVDFSVYDTSGLLLSSSQPLIFENRLLSDLLNPQARSAILQNREDQFIASEAIGSLHYNNFYLGLKSSRTGRYIGVLSVPFFESAKYIEKIRTASFSNIITVFALTFILFTIVSYYAANWLTYPLTLITKKLQTTALEGNKKMDWRTQDEIGMMVSEYNRMVDKLENSRLELARSQKEIAWREIAKQVAHEIKNPLTPMKLTLQQMEMRLHADGLSKDSAIRSIQTLLNQIEILNDIASSFSTFARMPALVEAKIDIRDVIMNVVRLHQNEKSGTLSFTLPDQPLVCLGDQPLLSRIISNITLNALQSGREGQMVKVHITAVRVDSHCLIQIRDDGKGIPEEIRERIFIPHFSTKDTGSGLGLAISKQGIEQHHGRIWFETSNTGTTFFIELPLKDS